MRHRKKLLHLGRKSAHRKSMLANMASSLIEHKRINTTHTKARALKMFVEPLITKSKNDSTHSRRIVFSKLRDKNAVNELFRDVATKIGDRPGGYTRIIRTGNRLGDNAEMAMIELVDYNTIYQKSEKKKTRRRGGKKKSNVEENTTNEIEVTASTESSSTDKESTSPASEKEKGDNNIKDSKQEEKKKDDNTETTDN